MNYPKRPRFFAHSFCRMLARTCAANEIGPGAFTLLVNIAMLEDSKRYSSAVTFYNEQLMPICGFGGRDRLVTARNRAIDAGWLHYEPGTKSTAGKYWVIVPDAYSDLPDTGFDDSDAVPKQDDNQDGKPASTRTASRTANPHLTNPKPKPSPKPSVQSEKRSGPEPSGFKFSVKQKGGGEWTLPLSKITEWAETFGSSQWVESELRKARQWCLDNPTRRKTPGGMTKFLGAWLARTNDSGRTPADNEPAKPLGGGTSLPRRNPRKGNHNA